MGFSFNPGDVYLGSFALDGYDARTKVSDFSVYENLMKPYVSLQATVLDSADMLNQLFGAGSNVVLQVSFGQPGQDPYEGTFTVTNVEKSKSMQNQRVTSYTISAYSRHMLRLPRVQKAYRETPGTDIVTDLVQAFLQPDKSVIVRDPSRGVMGNLHMPYNVNGVQIHKAIKAVLERSVSQVGSAYVLFENNKNMVVDTLENMIQGMSPLATYIQRPMGKDFLMDQVMQNFVILSMREESRNDLTNRSEIENQKVNPFDVFTHDNTSQVTGLKTAVSTIMNIAYNSLRPPTHLAETMPGKKKISAEFDNQSLTIHVPLNPALTVGSGFGVEVIAPLGDTNGSVRDEMSGTLLATEVRHTVDLSKRRMSGTTTVRGTKGGTTS